MTVVIGFIVPLAVTVLTMGPGIYPRELIALGIRIGPPRKQDYCSNQYDSGSPEGS